MKAPVKVGLIGVGGFGASHLKALRQLEAEGLARLECVAEPDDNALAMVRQELESYGVRWYSDYNSLFEKEPGIEAVAIAAPIHLHMEIAAAAIVRDLFVYLEKPPVPLVQQLNDLLALDVHKRVAVGFQLINSHPVQQVKLWVVQGALGNIQSLRVHGCAPRSMEYYARARWAGKMIYEGRPVFDGPATNALSHWLHNIMYLAGGTMDEFGAPVNVEAELYRVRPIESYDLICLRGRMESGASFQYVVTHATEKALPCRLEVVGTNGRAWIVENSALAGNNLGLSESVPPCADPFFATWRQFVGFACGERPRVATRLEDTRGYALSTNAALASSGGIHGIAQTAANFDFVELVKNSTRDDKLFSEMNVGWARCGRPMKLAALDPSTLTKLLGQFG